MDSVTKIQHYIEKAKQNKMRALCFTEHGNIFMWKKKKDLIEKAGMKYIHGVEAYVTKTLDEKVRDNYHVVLIAKNYEGVKEINYLMSDKIANNRNDGHFYYVPRITYEELLNTSDNIIITSACLGGVLNSNDVELEKDFVKFMIKNKDRCFLEIQHHLVKDQIEYNKKLYKISQATGLKLIAGTDTHSLNEKYAEGRVVLQKAKNIYFGSEEGWDLTFKTYNELVDMYKKQNSLPKDVFLDAINNTNVLINQVEDFTLDTSHKYPKLYDNSEKVFKRKIVEGVKERGVKLDKKKKNRILHEYDVMKKTNTIDYMLLEEDVKRWCRNNDIWYGYSRGSVSGSYIAYLLGITDMDSIKHNLIFERFINPERVSLADIDTDYPPRFIDDVKKYLYSKDGLYCADIITFNTIALKGAIRDVGRALEFPLKKIDDICKAVDINEDNIRKKYPELFKYVDLLNGVIVSMGTHPAGIVVSPYPLEDMIGTCTLKTTEYPVTQLNMKDVESINLVKLDLLGLDNIDIINETCKLAKIERLTPDNIDENDEEVWKSIRNSSLGIFQWESQSAWEYYKQLFSEDTIKKIKKINPDIKYIDLFSMGNGAIRPAGQSYRNSLANGEFKDHGNEALNQFLSSTLGHLVFQEQIIEFLHKFCGFSLGEADLVRRGFAKKTGTEQYMPKIKRGFTKIMKDEYGVSKEDSEKIIIDFIQVIEDASDYLFSINHSQAYSYIGYACAWLRYYYPLEFLAVMLNVNEDNQDKTAKVFEYINKFTNIKVRPIKFRYSNAKYTIDRDTNSIYKGIASIKYMNEKISNELFELGKNQYDDFVDLLVDIEEKTTCTSRQVEILIRLNFFSEFGKTNKLLSIYNEFSKGKNKYKKTYVDKTKQKRIELLKQYEKSANNDDINVLDKIKAEVNYMGYITTIDDTIPKDCAIITKIDTNRWGTHFFSLYRPNNGEYEDVKVYKRTFEKNPVDDYDMIRTINLKVQNKKYKKDGKWIMSDQKEKVLSTYAKVIV